MVKKKGCFLVNLDKHSSDTTSLNLHSVRLEPRVYPADQLKAGQVTGRATGCLFLELAKAANPVSTVATLGGKYTYILWVLPFVSLPSVKKQESIFL